MSSSSSLVPMSTRKRRSETAVVSTTSQPLSPEQIACETSKSKLCVRIKRYHGVAQWTWGNAKDEVCGICQSAYEGVAPGGKYPGEDCPVVWGKCSHAFHLQCVLTWLSGNQARQTCPICRQDWEFEAKENAF